MQPIRRRSRGNTEKFNVLVNCLVSANLTVITDPGGTSLVVGVERQDLIHQDQRTTVQRWGRKVFIEKWDGEKPTCLEDSCLIWERNGSWNFRNDIGKVIGWDWLNSVRIDAQTLEKVAETAISYLLKPPMQLSHWLVPVFQHPTWRIPKLSECITSAREVHISEAEDIKADAMDAVTFSGVEYAWHNKEQAYIVFRGHDEPWRVLYLRYDLSDAMIAIDRAEKRREKA